MKSTTYYPLLLRGAHKELLWGTEDWSCSCHPAGPSIILNGPLAGKTLPEVLQGWGITPDLPLVKIIDAKLDLSVQVHPANEFARIHENQEGKTEFWWILNAEPEASLIYGFNQTLTKEEFAKCIEENTLAEVFNSVPVEKGDAFFIPAGTLHAIGKGIRLAEVQQNSDVTYRVWDYDRTDAAGNKRELHTEKAVAVTDTAPSSIPYGKPQSDLLAECPYFRAERKTLNEEASITAEVPTVLLVTDGTLSAHYGEETITAQAGECILIPPTVCCTLQGNAATYLYITK